MKRKNKPIRRPDAVQPLPLPADADEIAFAHGVSRRVVVVDDVGARSNGHASCATAILR